MASTRYDYVIGDFPSGLNEDTFTSDIRNSSIVIALDYISVESPDVYVWFKDALSAPDESTLDALVAAHSGQALPGSTGLTVYLNESSTRTITGAQTWDRSSGGIFVPPSGLSFPVSPLAGELFWRTDQSVVYRRNDGNTSWVALTAASTGTVDHSTLINLSSDDHLQYLHLSGTRAMSGSLDMGSYSITNVNLVDGVDVSGHASRHDPGGSDPLATAAPAQGIGGSNAEGSASSFARSDHDHTIRETSGPTNLTVGSITDGQYLRRVGTTIVGAVVTGSSGSGLLTKAGKVLSASFSGNPKKATVTFSTAFSDADYAITLTPIINVSGFRYSPNVESQVSGSFVINMGANNLADLISCCWIAIQTGETA